MVASPKNDFCTSPVDRLSHLERMNMKYIITLFGVLSVVSCGLAVADQFDQTVDISSSAYRFRADVEPDKNDPESYLAVKYFADQPVNQPTRLDDPAVKRVLTAHLWEEIRPIRSLVLHWDENSQRRPKPEDLEIVTLDNAGSASSWWNNLRAAPKPFQREKRDIGDSGDCFSLNVSTCGVLIVLKEGQNSDDYDIPSVHVYTDAQWKEMEVEIEWGFEPQTEIGDYSGHITTYDAVVGKLDALGDDAQTVVRTADSWTSQGRTEKRRGIRFPLKYTGISKWRKTQPYTTQQEDVARSIITLWTKSGNVSFLAADLENGPIYAPEYGFFVRRVTQIAGNDLPESEAVLPDLSRTPLASRRDSLVGDSRIKGWDRGSDIPWLAGNATDENFSTAGIHFPSRTVMMHPGMDQAVAVVWKSPIYGRVQIDGSVSIQQEGTRGVFWSLVHETTGKQTIVAYGSLKSNSQNIRAENTAENEGNIILLDIAPGDSLVLAVEQLENFMCNSVAMDLQISQRDGDKCVWNLRDDVLDSIQKSNPHPDRRGNEQVWEFCSQNEIRHVCLESPSQPPLDMSSAARTANEFVSEWKSRNLATIRRRVRSHEEQNWFNAVSILHGADLPHLPSPPAGWEPPMQVRVPSKELTAQWNLGYWHLTRHAEKHPENGRLWFNDHPYGILAAENYMILLMLDLMGAHKAAEDGFDQWVSLPLEHPAEGHHEWSLPGKPSGLFTEGYGSLSFAVGPPGWGGHMDAVHAFGPGSIGYALVEHLLLSGDTQWFKESAPRILENANWMIRQRKVNEAMVPGGERLWNKGLMPALQVTPDSGGLWMQFYECEAYYWLFLDRFADAYQIIDPQIAKLLKEEAEDYRRDLLRAVERTIALSPVVPVRDGTYHSVIPFGCYVRGLSTGAWGWQRDGSGSHVGPLYWETVQSALPLISPAALLSTQDVRVQGFLDVLEDRLLLENPKVIMRLGEDVMENKWFSTGWHYQGGLERTANVHLAADDVKPFLRTWLNLYAINILPRDEYVFNEHTTQGPPDKIYEEAAFLERFRNLLVWEGEDGNSLWLAKAAPREWYQSGQTISVKNAPTHFGAVDYEINGNRATLTIPDHAKLERVILRMRSPDGKPIVSVKVNGQPWENFDATNETVTLRGLSGKVTVEVIRANHNKSALSACYTVNGWKSYLVVRNETL